ncbi:uncharacterized protein LOC134851974 [Symsagittifera roscoffensis]|uniref:uncharacterized protein LOC134851974 n=1 Tax=Symsagittifera roscoffensis TaxID=84072 RepID=UPI00307B63D3
MSCNRPSVRRYVSISPQLFSPYPNGTRVQFDCISPSKAGSRVPLKKFGSSWATCNGASGSWTFEDTNHAPHCESDVGDFESKLQIVVTVFACSLMACLVFLMFTFGFKAYNYRREYKKGVLLKALSILVPPTQRKLLPMITNHLK